jgi:hypothetical protein
MGQQEGNREANAPGAEEELDPFEQLAAALQAWTPDVSGDKKTLGLRKWDINLQTERLLELLIDWFEYRKSPEFAKCFEDKFRQFYTEVHEFYDKAAEGAFMEEELFNEQIPFVKASAERLALYVARVKAMCEDDAGIAPDGFRPEEEDQPPYVCINLKTHTIKIGGSTPYAPTAESIWTFLEELIGDSEEGEPTPKNYRSGMTMLRKVIGKERLRCVVTFSKDGYRLHPNVRIRR